MLNEKITQKIAIYDIFLSKDEKKLNLRAFYNAIIYGIKHQFRCCF